MNTPQVDMMEMSIRQALVNNHITGLSLRIEHSRYEILHKIPHQDLIKIFDAPVLSEHIPHICAHDPALSRLVGIELVKRIQELLLCFQQEGTLDAFQRYSQSNGWLGVMVLKYITENAVKQTQMFGVSSLDCLVIGLVKRIELTPSASKYLTEEMMQYIITLLGGIR